MQLAGHYMEADTLRYINAAARGRIQLTASSAHPELPYHLLSIITFCLNQVDLMFKLGDLFVLHGQKHCIGSSVVLMGQTQNPHILQTGCSQQQPSWRHSRVSS